VLEKIKNQWQELQPRERFLLSVMLGVFAALGLFVIVVSITRDFSEKETEIEKFREALYYLEDNQQTYLDAKDENLELREKLQAGNDIGVSSYLNKTANDLGFDVTVNPKSETPATTDESTDAMQQELQVTIRSVERDKLLDYLWKINQSDAPLYIQRLQINRSRATGSQATTNTQLSASVTVVAYRLDTEE